MDEGVIVIGDNEDGIMSFNSIALARAWLNEHAVVQSMLNDVAFMPITRKDIDIHNFPPDIICDPREENPGRITKFQTNRRHIKKKKR